LSPQASSRGCGSARKNPASCRRRAQELRAAHVVALGDAGGFSATTFSAIRCFRVAPRAPIPRSRRGTWERRVTFSSDRDGRGMRGTPPVRFRPVTCRNLARPRMDPSSRFRGANGRYGASAGNRRRHRLGQPSITLRHCTAVPAAPLRDCRWPSPRSLGAPPTLSPADDAAVGTRTSRSSGGVPSRGSSMNGSLPRRARRACQIGFGGRPAHVDGAQDAPVDRQEMRHEEWGTMPPPRAAPARAPDVPVGVDAVGPEILVHLGEELPPPWRSGPHRRPRLGVDDDDSVTSPAAPAGRAPRAHRSDSSPVRHQPRPTNRVTVELPAPVDRFAEELRRLVLAVPAA